MRIMHSIMKKIISLAATIISILSGRSRREFIYFLIKNRRFSEGSLLLSIFTTSLCNRRCKYCIMKHLMSKYPAYHLSIQDLEVFIRVAEKSRYRFDFILTGGEPLLWENLKEGVRLFKSSRICKSLVLFTNAIYIDVLDDEVVKYIDTIRVSRYFENSNNIDYLCNKYSRKIEVVGREEFWSNPTAPIAGSIPAECLNQEFFLFKNRIFACPHSASIAFGCGSNLCLSNPVDRGFINGLDKIRDKQQEEICSRCISNKKVRIRVQQVPNIKQEHQNGANR